MAYDVPLAEESGALSGRLGFVPHTLCRDTARFVRQETGSLLTGDRNAAFWRDRALVQRLPAVRAAVLDTSGYYDLNGHTIQDAPVWGSLPAATPKVQVRGWWGHDFPRPLNYWGTRLDYPSGTTTWEAVVLGWFDYWLKGVGPRPRTGVVYNQDQTLRWHEDPGWSAAPAQKEALFLADDALARTPARVATSFRSVPPPVDEGWGPHALGDLVGRALQPNNRTTNLSLCPAASDLGISRVFRTPPLAAPARIAGNPFVDFTLMSDRPAGLVSAELYDLAPTFTCTAGRAIGARWMASGAADLSFFNSPFRSRAFPVGRATEVRVDLSDITYALPPGHRLALVVSHGEVTERVPATTFPRITIGSTSQLVVPVADGTVGGAHPAKAYPPRPFTPPGYSD
jgi:predicted acyl esterase